MFHCLNLETNVESVLKQGMMEHQSQALFLERNGETSAKEHTHSREPIAKPQDTNTNLISSMLVKKNIMIDREKHYSTMLNEPLRKHRCMW